MLAGVLTLHSPNCRGVCAPADCVQDLEAFCSAVRAAHFGVGAKRGDGSVDGQLTLSSADADDVLSFLVSRAWELSTRFDPADDGRGTTRLAGFLIQRLHWAATDWVRGRWGSRRYPERLVVTSVVPAPDVEQHITGEWLDEEYDDGSVLDREEVSDMTRAAVELLMPLVDDETLSQPQLAALAGVPACRVGKAVRLVREEFERQGFAPAR